MAVKLDSTSTEWQTALETHERLLREHVQFWQKVCGQTGRKSGDGKKARVFQRQTMSMISQCKELAALTGISKKTEELKVQKSPKRGSEDVQVEVVDSVPSKKKKKKTAEQKAAEEASAQADVKYEPPVVDASGLFSIDTNPTPVNFGQAESKVLSSKKKRERQPKESAESRTDPDESTQRANKRIKNDHQSTDRGDVRLEGGSADEAERVIVTRLKEKDEKAAQKANKKRKWTSAGSEVDRQGQDISVEGKDAQAATGEQSKTTKMNGSREQLDKRVKKAKIDTEEDSETITVDVGASSAKIPTSTGKEVAGKQKRKKAK